MRVSRPIALRVAVVAALLGVVGAPAAPARADDFEAVAKKVREDLKSDKPEARLHALTLAGNARDTRAIDILVGAVGDALGRRATLAKAQGESEVALEKVLAEIEKANEAPSGTPEEIKKFNKRMKRLQDERNAIDARQRAMAEESMQTGAEVEAGVAALGALLKSLPPAEGNPAVERLGAAWFAKGSLEDRHRYISVLAIASNLPASLARLRAVSMDPNQHGFTRAMAVRGRGQPGDTEAMADLVALLDAPLDQGAWPAVDAAIDTLRRMHLKEAIAPLIKFLGHKDTGKLKRTAWKALKSLTGQTHGPYEEPWQAWWKDAEPRFTMPERPSDTVASAVEDLPPGATTGGLFFGEPLGTDRVMFVLDISKSMLDLAYKGATGARAKERRIDVLRREFAAAVDQLPEGGLFDVVLFASGVVVFSADGVVPDAASKARAKKFLDEAEPIGGTNIHDALETAFRLSTPKTAVDKAPYDTIVFLTDGTPSAGKLQKPDQILAAVAQWNAAKTIGIRIVGIGECDEDFLRALALQNRGTFVVKR